MGDLQRDSQTILTIADTLFEADGYDNVSLQSIADKAHLPIDQLKAEFICKAEIALKIYHTLVQQSLADSATLTEGTISERYFTVLEAKIDQLNQHKETVSALFAVAMRPQSNIQAADISPGMRDPMMQVMQRIIDEATDTPTNDHEELALFLYAFHFLVIVFWLYDRSDDKQASHMFTQFLRELVKLIRPMLLMPLVSKAVNKVAKIMMLVFGGARLIDPTSTEPNE